MKISSINSIEKNPSDLAQTFEIDGYIIEMSSTRSLDYLKKIWHKLEKKNNVPFFLTWHWISCWIKTYQPKLTSISATYLDEIVAIGLFTGSIESRHGFIRSHQLRLHQMGNILMDQIWMEYNDFIGYEKHRDKAVNACLKAIQQCEMKWDEIVLSMMPRNRARKICDTFSTAQTEPPRPCFAVKLSHLRDKKQDYIQLLNGNTRYQIRRSIRLYENKYGQLRLEKANSIYQALSFFHNAGTYHIQRWTDSGFKNRQFVKFHENLIQDCFEEKNIIFLKLLAGNETIAIMYYHIVGKKVYFYLHGLNYDKNKRLKPGLVAHTYATNYFIQQGMDEYDYMGGYSQYKEQLAQRTDDQVSVIIQRPRSYFKLEQIARRLKKKIMATSKNPCS